MAPVQLVDNHDGKMTRRPVGWQRWVILGGLAVGMVWWGLSVPVGAQGPLAPDDDPAVQPDEAQGRLVERFATRRRLERAVRVIQRATVSQDPDERARLWANVLNEELGPILREPRYRDHLVYVRARGRYLGARTYARELIGEGGDVALQVFRDHYGPAADRLLTEARLNRNPAAFAAIVSAYPFTEAAQVAAMRLGRIYTERGEFGRAAAYYHTVLAQPGVDRRLGAAAAAAAASCYAQLADTDALARLTKLVATQLSGVRAVVGHEEITLTAWLAGMRTEAARRALAPIRTANFPSYGGNATNTHQVAATINPERLRWERRFRSSSVADDESFRSQDLNYPVLGHRRFPVLFDETIYVPNRTSVYAFNVFAGDKGPLWSYREPIQRLRQYLPLEEDTDVIYTATADRDQLYVPLETPLSTERHAPRRPLMGWSIPFNIFFARRKLYCFDRRSGAIRWTAGGEWPEGSTKRTPEERVRTLSFTTAPLVVGNTLYLAAGVLERQNGHIYVVALDRRGELDARGRPTGKPRVLWVTRVASGQNETNMFGQPVREPFPSALAYADRAVFLSTNLGLVAAVDALTGEPRWAVPYDRVPFSPTMSLSRITFRASAWFNNPPMVDGDTVVFTPTNAAAMLAFDVRNGDRRWKLPRRLRGDEPRYLYGIKDGRLYFGGGRSVYEFSVATGRMVRPAITLGTTRHGGVFGTSRAPGRGCIAGGRLWVPTGDGVAEIELAQFKLVKRTRRGITSGNLVAGDSVVVALRDTDRESLLQVGYDREHLLEALRAQARAHPDAWEVQIRLANLAWQQGRTDEALRYFRAVEKLTARGNTAEAAQANQQARRGIFGILIGQAEAAGKLRDWRALTRRVAQARDYATTVGDHVRLIMLELARAERVAPEEEVPLYESLLTRYGSQRYEFEPGQRSNIGLWAHQRIAELAERQNQWALALAHWHAIATGFPDERLTGRSAREVALERIRSIFARAGRAPYQALEQKATRELQRARAHNDRLALGKLVARYPASLAAEQALLEQARLALAAKAPDEASEALRRLLVDYPGSERRPQAMALLAEVYEEREMFHAARSLYRQLAREYGSRTLRLRGREVEVGPFVAKRLKGPPYDKLQESLAEPKLSMPLALAWKRSLGENGNARLISPTTPVPSAYASQVYLWRRNMLECRDGKTGEELWRNVSATFVYELGFVEDRLVVVAPGRLLGLDPRTGRAVWNVALDAQVQDARISDGFVVVVTRDRVPRSRERRYRWAVAVYHGANGALVGRTTHVFDVDLYFEPIVRQGIALVYTMRPARIYGIDLNAPQRLKYEIRIDALNGLAAPPVIVDDDRFAVLVRGEKIAGQPQGARPQDRIRLYDFATGKPLAAGNVKSAMTNSLVARQDLVILGEGTHTITAFDPGTLTRKWSRAFGRRDFILRRALTATGLILVRRNADSRDLSALALDLADGSIRWEQKLDRPSSYYCQSITITDSHVLLALRWYKTVLQDGVQRQKLSYELDGLKRDSGAITQRIAPDMQRNVAPTLRVIDGALYLMQGDDLAKYTPK